jgi:hypothetical protein
VSGLKGLFDGNPEVRLVQPGDSYKVSVSILRRNVDEVFEIGEQDHPFASRS